MPEYLSPGVYVEEINTGPVPIEGVSTSTAGFVGQTIRGPLQPRLVTSFVEFQRVYGGLLDPAVSFLPLSVQGFFDNGGQRAFIARVAGVGAGSATLDIGGNLTVRASGPGEFGNRIFVRVAQSSLLSNGAPVGFRLTLLYFNETPPLPLVDPTNFDNIANPDRREPAVVEDFDNLRINPAGQDYVVNVLQSGSSLVEVILTNPANAVAVPPVAAFTQMANGAAGAPVTAVELNGAPTPPEPGDRRGLAGLEVIDEINILVVPDEVRFPDVTSEMINQCERLKDRFAVISALEAAGPVQTIRPPRDSTYAAFYYPWIRVLNASRLDYPLIPPSGHVAGIYARTDIDRGVHKAPANYEVRGMLTRDLDVTRKALQHIVPKGQHDILNPRGVNVIRDFRADGRGIRVWGARTMSSDGQWKYINVRRLFLFVEESIDQGTQWVVFEPNDEPTWARVRRSVGNFLNSVWRSGALMGATAEQAYFVKCDRTTMTQDDIDNGRLICYIGIAPVKPAEFVIFRISQKTIETEQ